jgi:hypothetical protein
MKKVLLILGLIGVFSLGAVAQSETPAAEVFGGYSFMNTDTNNLTDRFNVHGWNASVNGNFNRWFGIKGDFSGHYGSPDALGGIDVTQYTYLFGPQLTARGEKADVFVHALFGGARFNAEAGGISADDSAFAMAFGGGLDWKANKNFAVRVVQFDYLPTRFADDTQNNIRLSFGVVFKFGER